MLQKQFLLIVQIAGVLSERFMCFNWLFEQRLMRPQLTMLHWCMSSRHFVLIVRLRIGW